MFRGRSTWNTAEGKFQMERRLGRGLGALLPDTGQGRSPIELELDSIRPNQLQPRADFSPSSLEELRQSISNHGVLQPVVVRRVDVGYELICGERRWRAARLAGLSTIPAIVRPVARDSEMLELALVENLQREDLDPIERAKGFKQMMTLLGLTQEQVSERVGLKRSSIANHVRLLDLPESVQQAVSRGALSMGHARALLSLMDPSIRLEMASEAIREDLSVREVEQRVRNITKTPPSQVREARPRDVKSQSSSASWIPEVERRLQDHLGTKASIKNDEGYRGMIVLEYFGRHDLERIVDLLAPKATI